MKIEPGMFCPLLKKQCIKMDCAWFVKINGFNPNTGQQIEEWGCTVSWLPILLIENSQQQRQTGAAVESFRNEMVQQNIETTKLLIETVSQAPKRLESPAEEITIIRNKDK